jgi:hypothetical protein
MTFFDNYHQFIRWFESHQTVLTYMGIFSLVLFVGTLIAVPVIIVSLPHDLLKRDDQSAGKQWLNLWYLPYVITKNVFGFIVLIAGIVMLVLPGQGLLTIFLGLALINFPGKRKLIRRLLSQKRIYMAITRLRAKFNKSPLELPD